MIASSTNESHLMLGRYLTQKNQFSRMNNKVKYKTFMPPSDLNLSVFNIEGISIEDVWNLGENSVIALMPQPRSLYGVAKIQAGIVRKQGLGIDFNNIPQRHANISGWPIEEAGQMVIAQELAELAEPIFKEEQSP